VESSRLDLSGIHHAPLDDYANAEIEKVDLDRGTRSRNQILPVLKSAESMGGREGCYECSYGNFCPRHDPNIC